MTGVQTCALPISLRVTNERLSGILLHKIDSTTGEGIYGVKFLLYDKNKNPIGEFTTKNIAKFAH